MKFLFDLILFDPLYNALVFITNILPSHNIAISVIILTLIVKILLFPLYHKSSSAQIKIKEIEPKLKEIQNKYKDDKQKQAQEIMQLYKDHGVNPFSSFLLLFIQLPIIFALFFVFSKGFELNLDILYPFINPPEQVSTIFLNINVEEKSLLLAFLVGITQFFQMKLAIPPIQKRNNKTPDFKEDLMRSMQIQMKYVLPVIIVFISYTFPAVISVYWLTSNLFAIGHELIVKKKALNIINSFKKKEVSL